MAIGWLATTQLISLQFSKDWLRRKVMGWLMSVMTKGEEAGDTNVDNAVRSLRAHWGRSAM